MKLKHWENIFYVILNANSVVQYVIQFKDGIMINVNASVKSIIHAKKIIVGFPAHAFVKIVDIQKVFLML